jgi:hypothetical protein
MTMTTWVIAWTYPLSGTTTHTMFWSGVDKLSGQPAWTPIDMAATWPTKAEAQQAYRQAHGRLPRDHRAVPRLGLTTTGDTAAEVEVVLDAEVVDVEVLPADMTEAEAREVTERIRGHLADTWQLIAAAYTRRAWVALGYQSWDVYCIREFGSSQLRLPREERTEAVLSLRHAGLSIRAIESATGASHTTIQKDLAESEAEAEDLAESEAEAQVYQTGTPGEATVGQLVTVRQEGEPFGSPGEATPLPPEEQAAIHERLRSDREKIEAWKRAGESDKPATVTGRDGKTYPAQPAPRPAPDVPAPRVHPRPARARKFVEGLSIDLNAWRLSSREIDLAWIDAAAQREDLELILECLGELRRYIRKVAPAEAPR